MKIRLQLIVFQLQIEWYFRRIFEYPREQFIITHNISTENKRTDIIIVYGRRHTPSKAISRPNRRMRV